MISLNVKGDIKEVKRYLTDIERKQLPFATELAINRTGFHTRKKLAEDIERIFHQPTSFTKRGILYRKAHRKKGLTFLLYLREEVERYLSPHIVGGPRRSKRSEQSLRSKGALGAGQYLAPATRLRNARGNITRGRMQKIMSAVGGFREVGHLANRTEKSKARKSKPKTYFVLKRPHGSLAPGIWERANRKKVRPALVYLRGTPFYRKIFPFQDLAAKHSYEAFKREFNRALKDALRTARK